MPFDNLVLHEQGGSDSSTLSGSAPNVVDAGDNWEESGGGSGLTRDNARIESAGTNRWNMAGYGEDICMVTGTWSAEGDTTNANEAFVIVNGISGAWNTGDGVGFQLRPNRATEKQRIIWTASGRSSFTVAASSNTTMSNSAEISFTLTQDGTSITFDWDDGTNSGQLTWTDDQVGVGYTEGTELQISANDSNAHYDEIKVFGFTSPGGATPPKVIIHSSYF